MMEEGFLSFLIILSAGLFFSETFRRLHLPYVTALIIAGIVIGPLGLNIIQVTEVISFFGAIGVIFLMLMAGMEIKVEMLGKTGKNLVVLSLMNGVIPFVIGFVITRSFGYNVFTSLILGTIFISSSIAVVIPSLEANNLISTKIGSYIVGASLFEDIGSLFLLALILQTANPTTPLPLPIYILTIIASVIVLKIMLPKIERAYFEKRQRDQFEAELQFVFIVLIAVAVYFELLGMHSIIAGFLVGIILSDSIKHRVVANKLQTISYGLFIPIFFLVTGAETDLAVFFEAGNALALTLTITAGLILSKFLSGWIGGMFIGFSKKESLLIGAATSAQLSTSLATAFAAMELNLLDHTLHTAIVVLSMVTTLFVPIMIKLFAIPITNETQTLNLSIRP